MKHSLAISTALAATLALGSTLSTTASAAGKEKCYGITAAGQNDCGNLAGTHSCAGQSTVDNDIGDWRLVDKGSCVELGGLLKAETKAKYKSSKK